MTIKLTLEKLDSHLSTSLGHFYVISSDENLLAEEACKKITDITVKQGFGAAIRYQIENSPALWDQIQQSLQIPSLFNPKSCFVISVNSSKLDTKGKELLTAFSESKTTNNIVILKTPKIDAATAKAKWFQKLTAKAIWLTIYPINPQQLPEWIATRAKGYGLTLEADHIKMIAARTENNLLASDQALQKLKLLNRTITTKIVEEYIEVSTQYDIFKLSDACLAGQPKKTGRILLNLQQQGAEPILLIWTLAKEIRLQIQLLQKMREGASLQQACDQLRLWESRLPLVQRFTKRKQLTDCHSYLSRIATLDGIIKGITPGNIWHELQRLCFDIAGA